MRKRYFTKEGAIPMWVHIPGTPITLPGETTKYERLPGMTDWAPRGVVSRVGRGLAENRDIQDIAEQEANQGLLAKTVSGGTGGLLGGAMLSRLAGGEAVIAPFKDILKRGINKQTLQGLSKVPRMARVLPAVGLGIGAATGIGNWAMGRDDRKAQAKAVGRGLLSEQILQQHELNQARNSRKVPLTTATESPTKATAISSSGV